MSSVCDGMLSGRESMQRTVSNPGLLDRRRIPFCCVPHRARAAQHSTARAAPCASRKLPFTNHQSIVNYNSKLHRGQNPTLAQLNHTLQPQTKVQSSQAWNAVFPVAAAAIASLLLADQAWALPGEGVADLVSAAVPEQVSSAVSDAIAPVAQTTAAFIPGLIGDSPLREGIVSGFLLILFSELGDKTFFLALLLALKENKALVFAGTFGALAVMSVISVLLGQVVHQIDELGFGSSRIPLDDILACILLVFFGVQTILDARNSDSNADGEREEAEEEVSKFKRGAAGLLLSTFTLVFAAEWGDKSFLATIALAAASSPVGVTVGAVAGHGVATGIAVLGGSYLGKYLDEKVVQYLGGSLFLIFAAATAVDIVRGV